MPEITYREAVSTALREALNEDPLTFLAGEDIGPYGGGIRGHQRIYRGVRL